MYVEDLKRDFYNTLIGQQVLVLVHRDVDGICTWKILQQLFHSESVGIVYTVKEVCTLQQLQEAFQRHAPSSPSYCLLINCGAMYDLVDMLRPPENMILYVLDSHRPIDVCNVYSNGQVKIVGRDEEERVPNFDDIFRDDEEESDDADGEEDAEDSLESESRVERMQRKAEERRQRRRERLVWENNRDTLMFNYTQFSHFSKPSAVRMVELSWQLSRESIDIVWWGAVGLTDQLIHNKIESPAYILESSILQQHSQRLLYNTSGMHNVVLEADVRLILYRHWSVEDSIKHSPLAWGPLRLWGARGPVRLQRLLADMGLPLRQARQLYTAMELNLRKELLPSLERLREKYGLDELHYLSFCLKSGYSAKVCAADMVYSLLGLLESPSQIIADEISKDEGFHKALRALQLGEAGAEDVKCGIDAARVHLQLMGHNIESVLRSQQVVNAGPFLYVILNSGTGNAGSHVQWLCVLGRWLQRGVQHKRSPLLVAAPAPLPQHTLLLGLPPLTEDSTRNLFGKAFEQAAIKSQSDLDAAYFDQNIVSLPQDHLNKFLDALTTLLT